MKILNRMGNKLNGRHVSKKPNSTPANYHVPCKEEFSDWPHAVLAIGTFGNTNNLQKNPSSSREYYFTPEEVGRLQNELNLSLHSDLSLDKFLSTHSSLQAEKTNSSTESSYDNSSNKDCRLQCKKSLVLSIGKDNYLDNIANNAIGNKSLSFLLKKIFVCRSGFAPAGPSLRDSIPESRMEKILRAMLHRKKYPQSSSPKSSIKLRYLENKDKPKSANEDDASEMADNGSKWVKTDSEYIVLEI